MKRSRKTVTLLCATAVLLTSACSNGTAQIQSPAPGNIATPATPVKITYALSDYAKPLPDINDQPFVKHINQKANVSLDMQLIASASFDQNLRLKIASGEIPDLIQASGLNPAGVLTGNQTIPLDDLINKYGPNLKKFIPKDSWDDVTINGKIMGIPSVLLSPSNNILYIRKDWMEKVGGKIPQTSDELLDLLRLFRDKDPNGNGKQDEIAFTMRSNFTWWYNIAGMWGIGQSNYHVLNGEVTPDIINPNMKTALGFLKTMYDEKLLDSEFLTNATTDKKVYADVVGSFVHLTDSIENWNDAITKALPGKKPELIAIPTPKGKGYNGPVGGIKKPNDKYYVITKAAKNPEAIIKMLDWFATDEGVIFHRLGLEGDTYTKEGDKFVYDDAKDKTNKSDLRILAFGSQGTMNPIVDNNLKRTPDQQRLYNMRVSAMEMSRKEGLLKAEQGLPEAQTVKKFPDINPGNSPMYQEIAAKIVLGKLPLDAFDDYVKKYRQQGGDELIKEMTEAYNNLHAKK
ncbi:extracellular solute-binding protein [Paenibacillus sp. LMG 31458]|uniref:Extracellular solute-binding protein n=1 Tax=Paenibacillus phytorum TaxID=2654977 RepID=A0ABX1XRB0_9BACL|nr:extracellular solute-binding protein [Paenibacillus phytorum]NOU70385.1 extracellular solute-binding protein [Paenibacillus phytorum]